jgi:hypothetical protein
LAKIIFILHFSPLIMHQGAKTAIPQDGESRGEICVTLKGEDGFGKDSVPSRRLGEEIRS